MRVMFFGVCIANVDECVVFVCAMEEASIPPYVQQYCDERGYTDIQRVNSQWWAIPPGGAVPEPLEEVPELGEYLEEVLQSAASALSEALEPISKVAESFVKALPESYWEELRERELLDD